MLLTQWPRIFISGIKIILAQKQDKGFIHFYWCLISHACHTLQSGSVLFSPHSELILAVAPRISPACSAPCLNGCPVVSGLTFSSHVHCIRWWAIPWYALTTSPLRRLPAGLEHGSLSLSIWQHRISVVYVVIESFLALISQRVH